MKPSTWNDTNQHWVPQFLLKGFGLKGNASRVWEFDKQTEFAQIRKVKDVASEQRLMTEDDDELMSQIEIKASRPIDLIRKKRLGINERDRTSIDQLVVAMLQNDPYSGFDKETTRQEIIDATSRTAKEAFEHSGGIVETDTIKKVIEETFNHDYLTNTISQENYRVPILLRFMGLRAIYADEELYFIIGDSPVLAVRNRGATGSSLENAGSQVILPISSQCVLVYDWQTEPNLIADGGTANIRQIHSLNRDYSLKSNCRYLYGRNEESLAKARRIQLLWGNDQRSAEVSIGWPSIQQHLAAFRAVDAEMKKRDVENLRSAARKVVQQAARQNEMRDWKA